MNALVQQQQGIFDRLTALESKPYPAYEGSLGRRMRFTPEA